MKTSNNIEVVVPSPQPKAVVVLFGWLGAQIRHVNKYSQLYHARDCATVTGCAESFDILTANKSALDAFALDAAKKIISILKDKNQDLPVLAHVFSNGGTMPLSRLETLIHKANQACSWGKATPLDHDLILLGKAMQRGGEIFDSSPAFPDLTTASRAIASSVPNVLLSFLFQTALAFLAFVESQRELLSADCYKPKTKQLWNHVMNRSITPRAAYVYSTADNITNHEKLEELIAHRSVAIGAENILVQKFHDSDHVLHLRKHPKEYAALIDEMLMRIASGPPVVAFPAVVDKNMDEHLIIGGATFCI